MLLCGISDLEPGMKVGATVIHPRRPALNLLRPGVDLDAEMIRHLARLGVSELWVHHDATSDLDAAVAPKLSKMQTAVYLQLKGDIAQLARVTVSTAQIQSYRRTISELVLELTANGKYARLSRQLLDDPGDLFTHSTNVAFLSTLVGLELQTYVIRQRPRLPSQHARDIVPLGLGAMLHDIGKTGISPEARRHHEIHPEPDDPEALDALGASPHAVGGRAFVDKIEKELAALRTGGRRDADLALPKSRAVDLKAAERLVCEALGVPSADLRRHGNSAASRGAREIVVEVTARATDLTLRRIGEHYGLSPGGVTMARKRLRTPAWKKRLEQAEKLIRQATGKVKGN